MPIKKLPHLTRNYLQTDEKKNFNERFKNIILMLTETKFELCLRNKVNNRVSEKRAHNRLLEVNCIRNWKNATFIDELLP